jgi:hypothetical protein
LHEVLLHAGVCPKFMLLSRIEGYRCLCLNVTTKGVLKEVCTAVTIVGVTGVAQQSIHEVLLHAKVQHVMTPCSIDWCTQHDAIMH